MTQTTSESLITPALASEVANAFESPESLEAFVAALPAESVALYLARLVDAKTNIAALVKGLEQRLNADKQVGKHWTFDGQEYGFYGSKLTGWRKKDIPALIPNLIRIGISPASIATAVSEMRVTDLRVLADSLPAEQRAEALELIEEARVTAGERGEPRFQAIDEKYVKK